MRDLHQSPPTDSERPRSPEPAVATTDQGEPDGGQTLGGVGRPPAVLTWEYDTGRQRFTFVNDQCQSLLGHSRERWLTELTLRDIIHPDDYKTVAGRIGQGIESLDYRLITADGQPVWVRDFTREVVGADGSIKVVGVCWDISTRIQASGPYMEAAYARAQEEPRKPDENAHGLSPREMQVLRLVAFGMTDKEIALELEIRPKTVSKHIENILSKTGCSSRTEAGVLAVREGFAGIDVQR